MSRPQFPVNASQTASVHTAGPIVNGGLIDFQDNYHRGLNDYTQFLAAQQSMNNPVFSPVNLTPTQIQNHQLHAGLAQAGLPQTTLLGHPSTLLGHPSFINVAGKMYKPVDEPVHEPKRVEAPVPEQPRPITDEDVDRRVQKKLNEWASSQRPNRIRSVDRSAEDRATARVKSVNAAMNRKYYSPA